jgi:hypothetical protein
MVSTALRRVLLSIAILESAVSAVCSGDAWDVIIVGTYSHEELRSTPINLAKGLARLVLWLQTA